MLSPFNFQTQRSPFCLTQQVGKHEGSGGKDVWVDGGIGENHC